jgi:beta-N-acetylhexosaminidase
LLREQLGFQGVAITDALNMGAVTRRGSVSEASIQALLAGADILLQPPGERVVIDAVVRAVESGRIPRARIDEATRRVLMAKAAAGLHRGATVNRDAAGRIVGAPAHAEVARRIAEGSIVLARDRNNLCGCGQHGGGAGDECRTRGPGAADRRGAGE